jgi:hypothetical protein
MKNRLEENWEYVFSSLSYWEFEPQVNVFLKFFNEVGASRLDDCPIEHWEGMKWFITLEAKQGEAVRNHVMCALMTFPRHIGHGGKVGVVGRLGSS